MVTEKTKEEIWMGVEKFVQVTTEAWLQAIGAPKEVNAVAVEETAHIVFSSFLAGLEFAIASPEIALPLFHDMVDQQGGVGRQPFPVQDFWP